MEEASVETKRTLSKECSQRPAKKSKDMDDEPECTLANLHFIVEEQKEDVEEHQNLRKKFRYNGDYLMNWIAKHLSNPYPTKDEKDELMAVTGLSATHLNNWLNHTRTKLGMDADEYKAERLPQALVD